MSKSLFTIPLGVVMALLSLYAAAVHDLSSIGIFALVALVTAWNTLYTVEQRQVAVLTIFGRFVGAGRAGLNWKIPFICNIRTKSFSLQLLETEISVDTYTENSVPVVVNVAVQYYVDDSWKSIEAAFFRLTNAKTQINSYVETAVRARIPTHNLSSLLTKQKELSDQILADIGPQMEEFGYKILTTLVKNIKPPAKVSEMMAAVAEAEYEQKAAEAKGEAVRIKMAKDGEGAGDFRARFLEKFHDGLAKFELDKLAPDERARMYDLLSLSMMLEAWKEIGASQNAKTLFLPPLVGGDAGGMRQAVLEAMEASRTSGRQPARS